MNGDSLILKCSQKFLKVELETVTCFAVNDYLLTVFFLDGSRHTCCSSLKKVEGELPETFFKISRSCLLNVALIQSLQPKEKCVIMQNGHRLQVARSKWPGLRRFLAQHNQSTNGASTFS